MKKIGLLSDTHGYWDEKFSFYFKDCDEVWHAGDIGSLELAERFEQFKTFRAVYGNIDDQNTRMIYPESLRFVIENVDVLIKHIGGYPGNYDISVQTKIKSNPPKLFISGHSHILKVMYDKDLQCLHINPGSAGKFGSHNVRTIINFVIDEGDIRDLEIIELK